MAGQAVVCDPAGPSVEVCMVLPVHCNSCGRGFEVGDEMAGRQVRCPCGQSVRVGEPPSVVDFLQDELDVKDSALFAETPAQWAKATGAPPEIAREIEKRMAKKLSSNAGFMMAMTGAVIALMLIIGLVAFLMARQ